MDRLSSLAEHAVERVDAYASFFFEIDRGGVVLDGPVRTLLFDGDGGAVCSCELWIYIILRILVLLIEFNGPGLNRIVAWSYRAALLENARLASACNICLIHRHTVDFPAGTGILGWRLL